MISVLQRPWLRFLMKTLSQEKKKGYCFCILNVMFFILLMEFHGHFSLMFGCLQKYHRDLLLRLAPPASPPPPSPPPPLPVLETSPEKGANSPIRRGPGRRGKDRRAGSRRHRKVVAGGREMEPS